MNLRGLLVILGLAFAALAACRAGSSPPDAGLEGPGVDGGLDASVDTGALRFIGRFDFSDDAGPRFAWSGSSVVARFEGAALTLRLQEASGGLDSNGDPTYNAYDVVIDGRPPLTVQTQAGVVDYPVDAGLDAGVHQVLVHKRSEANVGEAQLLGLDFGPSGKLLPPPAPAERRIEFIGDSITTAYGIEGPDKDCGYTVATQNHSSSYAALTARSLEAEQVTIAWSGKGLYRNGDDSLTETMPVLWERTLPERADSGWDFTRWVPHVVVVNLSTNDFASDAPPQSAFQDAYRSFLQSLRARYPDAHLVATVGPMLNDFYPPGEQALTRARDWISAVVAERSGQGDAKVWFLEFPEQDEAVDGLGCDWHPSLSKHQKMAEQLTTFIGGKLGW